MTLAPPVIFGVLLIALASGYHAVTEHHVHKRIAHLVNPRVVIPETRHDSRWHAASHGLRWAVNAAMLGAAVTLGLAWGLSPRITTVCVIIAVAAFFAAVAVRGISARLGRRHQPQRSGEED